MKRSNQLALWQLDRRLAGLAALEGRIGQPPRQGWVKTLREALGLTHWDVGQRIGLTGTRIWQIEQAEGNGLVQLGTLQRVAPGLNCRLFYVLVPDGPLESMDLKEGMPRYSTE